MRIQRQASSAASAEAGILGTRMLSQQRPAAYEKQWG
jgi:hypothetical protein